MALWLNILFFVCIIIVPVISMAAGYIMFKKPPKEINDTVGYRTKRSKASQEAWDFANKYCGKNTLISGIIMLVASTAVFCFLCSGKSTKEMLITTLIIMAVQVALLVLVMAVPTEMKLKKLFDKGE